MNAHNMNATPGANSTVATAVAGAGAGAERRQQAHALMSQEKPAHMKQGKARPWRRATKAKLPTQPAYVYFLAHSKEPRIKVGVSLRPLDRMAQLPEAADICVERSWVVQLPDERRAYEIERLLHKALAPQAFAVSARGVHQGRTEWFADQALPVAMRLLQSVPRTTDVTGTLSPQPLRLYQQVMEQQGAGRQGEGQQAQQAQGACLSDEHHNRMVVAQVSQHLLTVADHLPVQLVHGPGQEQTSVVISGFRNWTRNHTSMSVDMQISRVRSAVVDLESYRLRGGPQPSATSRPWSPAPCLVNSLSYAVACSDDLVIRFASPRQIARLPGAPAIRSHLKALFAQLELACVQASFAQVDWS